MLAITAHDSQFEVPVGNIFGIWELVEPLVSRIHRCADWSFDVTLAAGMRLVTIIADPIEGVPTTQGDRSVWLYRTPSSLRTGTFLRVICVHGVFVASVVTEVDVRDEIRDFRTTEEFLYG